MKIVQRLKTQGTIELSVGDTDEEERDERFLTNVPGWDIGNPKCRQSKLEAEKNAQTEEE